MSLNIISRTNLPAGNTAILRIACLGLEAFLVPDCDRPTVARTERRSMRETFDFVRALAKDELLICLASPEMPLNDRLAAGIVLAFTGDPRIEPFNPQMIAIPAACATIGLEPDRERHVVELINKSGGDRRPWVEKERPAHTVELQSFSIAKYPVTNTEYEIFVREKGATHLPKSWLCGRYPHSVANAPVHGISGEAASAYVDWLVQKTGRSFRLPREAEWEFAASGPEHFEYPWGDKFDTKCANTLESGMGAASPVGAFPAGASPFGVVDMAGNVEEFVADHYAPYPGGEFVRDDLYDRTGGYRIARGGAFNMLCDMARTRRRHGGPNPTHSYCAIGFRLAEDRT